MKVFQKKLQKLGKKIGRRLKNSESRKNGQYAILVYDKVFWREKRSSENSP